MIRPGAVTARLPAAPLLALAAALALPTVSAAQGFEGRVVVRSVDLDSDVVFDLLSDDMEEPEFDTEEDWFRWTAERLFDMPPELLAEEGEAEESILWVKGTVARFEPVAGADGAPWVRIDYAAGVAHMVVPARRAYVEIALDEAQDMEMDDPDPEDEGLHFEPSVRALGETQVLAGIPVAGFVGEAGPEIGRAWCADGPSHLADALRALAESVALLGDEEDEEGVGVESILCEDAPAVRTRVVGLDPWGGGVSYWSEEVLAVEEGAVPAERFEIPASFAKVTVEELWRGGGIEGR